MRNITLKKGYCSTYIIHICHTFCQFCSECVPVSYFTKKVNCKGNATWPNLVCRWLEKCTVQSYIARHIIWSNGSGWLNCRHICRECCTILHSRDVCLQNIHVHKVFLLAMSDLRQYGAPWPQWAQGPFSYRSSPRSYQLMARIVISDSASTARPSPPRPQMIDAHLWCSTPPSLHSHPSGLICYQVHYWAS